MGLWNDIVDGVNDFGRNVVDKVYNVVQRAREITEDFIQTIVNGVCNAINGAAKFIDKIFGTHLAGSPIFHCPGPPPKRQVGELEVTVKQKGAGTPIEGAQVQISGPRRANGRTDRTGKISFKDLRVGKYQIDVEKKGFFEGSTSATVPPGGKAKATVELQKIEIVVEVNNTPAVNDDLVQLKCLNPAHRHHTPCQVKLKAPGPRNVNVVLANPDSRLRFPLPADTTKALTLPSGGGFVGFSIGGAKASTAIGDAVIEVHLDSAGGVLLGSKGATVFSFDNDAINLTATNNYGFSPTNSYTAIGGHGVDHTAKARIRPAGVDCSAPMVTNLRVGVAQNTFPPRGRVRTWTSPTIVFSPALPSGIPVTVPTTRHNSIKVTLPANDTDAFADPLYDRPGAGQLTATSLNPPTGCAGGADSTTFDTPSTPVNPTLVLPVTTTIAGLTFPAGTVTWGSRRLVHTDNFISWVVIFDTVTKQMCPLRERSWTLNMDSNLAGQKPAVAASDKVASTAILSGAPFSNTRSRDPANNSSGASGAATTTFTKP